ncbi:transposase, partial [Saccharicrinis aurantiacus]|uniref:transposase n=1 Tax=Saccharicrinis aurantiacus TaxID=1849719 RepID=UPI002491BFB9
IKKNMKNALMHIHDKVLLKKRALIETVNDELKNICQIEHTRHRSFENFLSNLIAGLIAYHFLPKKPSLNIDIIDNDHINKAA